MGDHRFRLEPMDENGNVKRRDGPESDRYAVVCHECGALLLEGLELRHSIVMHEDGP